MNNLYRYIAAIKEESNSLTIVSQESQDKSYLDQGVNVQCSESFYHFSNGVTVKYCIESEDCLVNELVCPECWISYEVVCETENTAIRPRKKIFTNQCQGAFWLKMSEQEAN